MRSRSAKHVRHMREELEKSRDGKRTRTRMSKRHLAFKARKKKGT